MIRRIIPKPLINLYHYSLSLLGAVIFRFPSKELKVIGVTGTSGKSTTVELISKIFTEAGIKTASLSSISFRVGKEEEEKNMLKMTMPGRFRIQQFLRKAVKEKCLYAVIEVTSEGIKQFRHKFIDFEVAVFTNLSPEHIESHGGFENYKEAKAKLFYVAKNIHVINKDDSFSDYFWKIPAKQKIGFTINDGYLVPKNPALVGFNLYNAIAAAKVAISQGISPEICAKAFNKFTGTPGRVEIIASNPFVIVVDYAHTPEQLKQLYKLFKSHNKICVLGSCGGGRDKWKRSVMGKIAQEFCHKTIITNEDPYDENPMDIINDVAGKTQAEKILDRKEAIKRAVQIAKENDVMIITGKGSEPWMCTKEGKIPWDDRKVAREEFDKLYPKANIQN